MLQPDGIASLSLSLAMSKPTVFCFSSSLVVGLHELLGAYSAWLGEPAAAETEAVPEPAAAETEAERECTETERECTEAEASVRRSRRRPYWRKGRVRPRTVSYTHLTLPTNREV